MPKSRSIVITLAVPLLLLTILAISLFFSQNNKQEIEVFSSHPRYGLEITDESTLVRILQERNLLTPDSDIKSVSIELTDQPQEMMKVKTGGNYVASAYYENQGRLMKFKIFIAEGEPINNETVRTGLFNYEFIDMLVGATPYIYSKRYAGEQSNQNISRIEADTLREKYFGKGLYENQTFPIEVINKI